MPNDVRKLTLVEEKVQLSSIMQTTTSLYISWTSVRTGVLAHREVETLTVPLLAEKESIFLSRERWIQIMIIYSATRVLIS